MSDPGAFENEMNHELDHFLSAVKAALPVQPDPRLEGSLIPRLAETARASRQAADGRAAAPQKRRRVALPMRIAFATSLLLASMAGLAVAGVKLPDQVESGFEAVGINLPNQTGTSSQTTPVPTAPTGSPPNSVPKTGGGNGEAGSNAGHGKKSKSHTQAGSGQSNLPHGKGKGEGKQGNPPGQAAHGTKSHTPAKGSKAQGKSSAGPSASSPGKGNQNAGGNGKGR